MNDTPTPSPPAEPLPKAPPQDLFWGIGLLLSVVPITNILHRLAADGRVDRSTPSMVVATTLACAGAVGAVLLHRRLAPRHAELGVVVPAGMLLLVSVVGRAWTHGSSIATPAHLVLATVEGFAVGGGLFPLLRYAREQLHVPETRLVARSFAAGVLTTVVLGGLSSGLIPGDEPGPKFLRLALTLGAGSIWALYRMPVVFMRFVAWLLARVVYRVEVVNSEYIATEGPQVLVCNHVAFNDWLIVAGTSPRPGRFVMDKGMFQLPVVRTLCTIADVIPIAPRKVDPDLLERSFDRIAEALDNGQVVCIFPEGKITRDGRMQPFRPGIERIIARNPVPVVPMAVGGLWGSFFSRVEGSAMRRPFRRGIFNRIALVVGPPIPPEEVDADRLRETVAELLVEAETRAGTGRTRADVA
jgi:1-acyl-sn-glycerol-3-phosphate acyltransferase